jgi:hypothetical protein
MITTHPSNNTLQAISNASSSNASTNSLDKTPTSEMITSPPSNNTLQSPSHASSSNVSRTSLDKTPTSEMITSPFNFCRVPMLKLPAAASSPSLGIGYQCSGEAYEDFSSKLESFTIKKSRDYATRGYGTSWGRRKSALPADKTILLFGNSHLRQVGMSLICQYWAQAHDFIRIDNDTLTVHFYNNVTIHIITNNPFVYSKQWVDILESRLLKRPIASLDAIVLGKFNGLGDSQNSSFFQAMQELSASVECVDFNGIEPPGIEAVARAYNGSIVAVSMFAQYAQSHEKNTKREINKLTEGSKGRKNLRFIPGRKYINGLGLECGSDTHEGGTCNERRSSTVKRDPRDMHRCMGAHGGHPDLLAFDVVEELFALLE